MNHATIADLEVRPEQKITPMVIKNLVQVVNNEFNRQRTLYNAKNTEEKEQILAQYRKAVGYTALKKAYDKAVMIKLDAEKKVKEAERKLTLKGLTIHGNQASRPHSYCSLTEEEQEQKDAVDKLDKLLAVAETNGPDNIRNKVISRLWIATTVGEAMVILREVLGNGIIPTLSVKQLTQEV